MTNHDAFPHATQTKERARARDNARPAGAAWGTWSPHEAPA